MAPCGSGAVFSNELTDWFTYLSQRYSKTACRSSPAIRNRRKTNTSSLTL